MRYLKCLLDDDHCLPIIKITNQMLDVVKVSYSIIRNALNDLGYKVPLVALINQS